MDKNQHCFALLLMDVLVALLYVRSLMSFFFHRSWARPEVIFELSELN